MGVTNFNFYLILSIVMMLIQYIMGPKIVEWSMRVKYVKENEYPELHRMVKDLSMKAKIHTPRIGIADVAADQDFGQGVAQQLADSQLALRRAGVRGTSVVVTGHYTSS